MREITVRLLSTGAKKKRRKKREMRKPANRNEPPRVDAKRAITCTFLFTVVPFCSRFKRLFFGNERREKKFISIPEIDFFSPR